MSVSPRTVPQDEPRAASEMNGKAFDLQLMAKEESPMSSLPPILTRNPFQVPSQKIRTGIDKYSNSAVSSISLSLDPDCSSIPNEGAGVVANDQRLSSLAECGVRKTFTDPHFNQNIWRVSAIQTLVPDQITESMEIPARGPSSSMRRPEAKSLPQSALSKETNAQNCTNSQEEGRQEPLGRSSVATPLGISILRHTHLQDVPSLNLGPPSTSNPQSSVPKDAKSNNTLKDSCPDQQRRNQNPRIRTNLEAIALETTQIAASGGIGAHVQNRSQSHSGHTVNNTSASDSDVQVIFAAPRRKRRRKRGSRTHIQNMKQHSATQNPRPTFHYPTSTRNSSSHVVLTHTLTKKTPSISCMAMEDPKIKRCDSERPPDVNQVESPEQTSNSNLPMSTLETTEAPDILTPFPPISAPNTAFHGVYGPRPGSNPLPLPKTEGSQQPAAGTSCKKTGPKLQPDSPKRGRPKKEAPATKPQNSRPVKPVTTNKQDKINPDLTTRGTPRKRRKVAIEPAKGVNTSDTPAKGPLGASTATVGKNSGCEVDNKELPLPVASLGNGCQTPCAPIAWQSSEVAGGFLPLMFPSLPFNYDWQQPSMPFYAQMYPNMHELPHNSQNPQHQTQQSSQPVRNMHQQTKHQTKPDRIPNGSTSDPGNVFSEQKASQIPKSTTLRRKHSLYSVPPWPELVNNSNDVASPVLQTPQPMNRSYVMPCQRTPNNAQIPSNLQVLTSLPHSRSSPRCSNSQLLPRIPNTATSSFTYPTNMIVDIAQTCQENFPFAKIAEKYKKPIQEVYDSFSAIIQIPLLKSAIDNKRMEKLAATRMNEFREIRKGVSEVHDRELKKQEAARQQAQNAHIQSLIMQGKIPSRYPYYPLPPGYFPPSNATQ